MTPREIAEDVLRLESQMRAYLANPDAPKIGIVTLAEAYIDLDNSIRLAYEVIAAARDVIDGIWVLRMEPSEKRLQEALKAWELHGYEKFESANG